MNEIIYYYETEDGSIKQYIRNMSEIFLVSILSRIGKYKLDPSFHGLPKDIKVFYFPSGRIWYRNDNRFVAEHPIKFRQRMMTFMRQQGIEKSKNKKL